jgi:hypothetical protein
MKTIPDSEKTAGAFPGIGKIFSADGAERPRRNQRKDMIKIIKDIIILGNGMLSGWWMIVRSE